MELEKVEIGVSALLLVFFPNNVAGIAAATLVLYSLLLLHITMCHFFF